MSALRKEVFIVQVEMFQGPLEMELWSSSGLERFVYMSESRDV